MRENICFQCKTLSSGPTNRLVQDACGHKKCRVCLLEDEEQCKQCEIENYEKTTIVSKQSDVNGDKNGDTHTEIFNNHTAVIQVNGNVCSSAKTNGQDGVGYQKDSPLEAVCVDESTGDILKPEIKNVAKAKIKKPDKEKRAYSSIDIPKHITVNSEPFSYHCSICQKNFVTKTHVKYHTYCAGAAKPYKCEICQKEFVLRAQLDVHSYKHKNNKPFTCTVCKKSFSVRSKLTRHSAVHSAVKSHICSECGNAYRSKESLKIHSIIHKGEKPYACKLCKARFSNQSNLNKHAVLHSTDKTHMCDQCGKRFKLKWALSVHRKSHLRIKPHECRICHKAFVNNKDLQRHSLVHADTKAYTCSICSTSFRRKDNLQRHMKNTHPGKKGEVIKNIIPPPSPPSNTTTNKKLPIDNPNAINVITTASPAFTKCKAEARAVSLPSVVQSDCRAGGTSVINGPIKLAFKTPAFKSNYNINRDLNYVPPTQHQKAYDRVESVDICQKILSTNSSTPPRNIIRKVEPTSQEICQKILAPYSSAPLHYETSFQNKKHALIKNIKFKVPSQYTSHFKDSESTHNNNNNVYVEHKPITTTTSVIVNNNNNNNNSDQSSNMHWRRRTSQNLGLKN